MVETESRHSYAPPMTKPFVPHGDHMPAAIDLRCIEPSHVERNPMSTLAHRAAATPRWSDLPIARASKSYFVLGQNAQGLWVIRENTGNKAGVFKRDVRVLPSRAPLHAGTRTQMPRETSW
jgi:hypothetical protein